MLGAHISVVEGLGFFCGESQNFLHPGRIRNIADHLLIGAGAYLLLDFHADSLEIEPEFLENIDGDALPQLDEPKQQMFGSHKIVVDPIDLFASKRENLLGARGKIVHRFVTHTSTCKHLSSSSNPE